MNILKIAEKVFEIESKEISNLSNLLTDDFENAVKSVFNSRGKFIISGMGKSGIIKSSKKSRLFLNIRYETAILL